MMIFLSRQLSSNAYLLAYLDPGSGSIVVQVLIAGLMAAGIVVKVFWKKIKALFNRQAAKHEDASTDQS